MKTSKLVRRVLIWTMTFLMSNISSAVLANGVGDQNLKMIPTRVVFEEFSRDQAEQEIGEFLGRGEVEAQLLKQGISPNEISERLTSLSEQELRQLSFQVKEARAGGDVLYTILILFLIIFLAQRI